MLGQLKVWAAAIMRDVVVVWLAARDQRTPWSARIMGAIVAAYAFSPIDLIPDFIPVIGLLDDLLLVPAGLWLTLRLIPTSLLDELREQAARMARPRSPVGMVIVVLCWAGLALLAWSLWA